MVNVLSSFLYLSCWSFICTYNFTTAVLWLLTKYHLFYLWSVFLPTKQDNTPGTYKRRKGQESIWVMHGQADSNHTYLHWMTFDEEKGQQNKRTHFKDLS